MPGYQPSCSHLRKRESTAQCPITTMRQYRAETLNYPQCAFEKNISSTETTAPLLWEVVDIHSSADAVHNAIATDLQEQVQRLRLTEFRTTLI